MKRLIIWTFILYTSKSVITSRKLSSSRYHNYPRVLTMKRSHLTTSLEVAKFTFHAQHFVSSLQFSFSVYYSRWTTGAEVAFPTFRRISRLINTKYLNVVLRRLFIFGLVVENLFCCLFCHYQWRLARADFPP